jgi:hypothetical protein
MHELKYRIRRWWRRDALQRQKRREIRGRENAAVGRETRQKCVDETSSEPVFAPDEAEPVPETPATRR